MKRTSELRCCLGCGRDTRGEYCSRCIGRENRKARKGRSHLDRLLAEIPLEDDYGDESTADSVCEDNSASTSRVA